ncbi:guanylate kinase [Mycoplasma phocoenae]|uniref:Guanylate kinase n=1 Tax=Mycoplasma phocoenae TaxID=754517 RepID=A0A858U827_9MOLU|nr:guanylate kinase [Mycoplasma phocoenae]QJG66886.1 guanylate kinase [Mycoplasma phocoenae]
MYDKKIIIFTGPSGVGKGTVEKHLFKDIALKLKLSVSATTRQPRNGEEDGIHYYFISKEEFEQHIAQNNLLEYSHHFNNYYGTLFSELDRISSEGYIPFLEVETNGALQILNNYKENNIEGKIISIFVMPPSYKELKRRITERGSETPETIELRMEKAFDEIMHASFFQYTVINETVEDAYKQIKAIIEKEFNL